MFVRSRTLLAALVSRWSVGGRGSLFPFRFLTRPTVALATRVAASRHFVITCISWIDPSIALYYHYRLSSYNRYTPPHPLSI